MSAKKGLLLYQRIIIIQFVSILIIMVFFGMYLYNFNLKKETGLMTIQTGQLMKRLSASIAVPLWNYDTDVYNNIIMQEMENQYINSILIFQDENFLTGRIKIKNKDIIEVDDSNKYREILDRSYQIKKEKCVYTDTQGKKTEVGEIVFYITDAYIKTVLSDLLIQILIQMLFLIIVLSFITFIVLNLLLNKPLKQITNTAIKIANGDIELQAKVEGSGEIAALAIAFNSMTTQLRNKAEGFRKTNAILLEIITRTKEIIVKLNSSSKEIEAATQEQTSASNSHASGITEISATLEQLTITMKQITNNVGELVLSSEAVIKALQESEKKLTQTVTQLEEVGKISKTNALEIVELGKRSVIINEMVELIKDVTNKINILSINASIEASRSEQAKSGFSVVAAEIRELSKETFFSTKKVEIAAKDIQNFLNSIIISSESESVKVVDSGKTVKNINDNIEEIIKTISNNYSFTQKIDVSINQQESGSKQAADTMRQMSEIARQSAETARQTMMAVKDIVNYSKELDKVISVFNSGDA